MVAALLAGACGSDDGPGAGNGADRDADAAGPGPAASDDGLNLSGSVCDLLTADDLTDAVGRPFGEGRGDAYSCTWDSTDDDVALVPGQVSLDVTTDGLGSEEMLVSMSDEEVDDLGDEAHWSDSLSNLVVIVGESFFSIQVLDTVGEVDERDAAIRLAELVLQRA